MAERRAQSRRKSGTTVYVSRAFRGVERCRLRDVSRSGAFVESEDPNLMRGTVVELAFKVDRSESLTKVYRRSARVVRRSPLGFGLRFCAAARQG